MKKIDWLIISVLIILGLFFRLLNTTPERLHFRGDQATSSLRAKEIWDNKELTLVGIPITSFSYNGYEARISSTAYYLQLIPLLMGGFNPYHSNRAMAVVAVLMIIPLYWGTKMLTKGKRWSATLIAICWALLPNFVQFTTFLWNPNSQLLLLPVAVFMMGKYEDQGKSLYLGLAGVLLGLALTLHFQFLIAVVAVIGVYLYVLGRRSNMLDLLWLIGGGVVGFSPMIVSELITNFYNARIFSLIFSHLSEVSIASGSVGVPMHYLNSIIFWFLLGVVLVLARVKAYLKEIAFLLGMLLTVLNSWLFLSPAMNKFSLIEPPRVNWTFATEERVHEIIVASNPDNFNIYNIAYLNPFADIQKYLLAVHRPEIFAKIQSNYYENKQLFIMARRDHDLSHSVNYEINTFAPSKTSVVPINDTYDLHYWERE